MTTNRRVGGLPWWGGWGDELYHSSFLGGDSARLVEPSSQSLNVKTCCKYHCEVTNTEKNKRKNANKISNLPNIKHQL